VIDRHHADMHNLVSNFSFAFPHPSGPLLLTCVAHPHYPAAAAACCCPLLPG
jgi:hypothetical protein